MKATSFSTRTPAAEVLAHRRAWRQDDTHYEVIARDGAHRYEVSLQPSGELSCTCTAGSFHRPCWHEQKVARRLLREGPPASILQTAEDEIDDLEADDEAVGRVR
jgi:hypothetical protein